ncbi:MAG TPA: SirB2 family protein [Burkholderiaceae bacterium]|nr:SirB2 family protein [Burkholderiaceae bacterium]
MPWYPMLKAVHVTAVTLSGLGFFARGLGVLRGARWARSRLARTLPHGIDAVLLASAIALAGSVNLSASRAPWLAAKLVGLLAYIGLGLVTLRFARRPPARAAAWVAALVVFAYIVSVAITKDPRGFLRVI